MHREASFNSCMACLMLAPWTDCTSGPWMSMVRLASSLLVIPIVLSKNALCIVNPGSRMSAKALICWHMSSLCSRSLSKSSPWRSLHLGLLMIAFLTPKMRKWLGWKSCSSFGKISSMSFVFLALVVHSMIFASVWLIKSAISEWLLKVWQSPHFHGDPTANDCDGSKNPVEQFLHLSTQENRKWHWFLKVWSHKYTWQHWSWSQTLLDQDNGDICKQTANVSIIGLFSWADHPMEECIWMWSALLSW